MEYHAMHAKAASAPMSSVVRSIEPCDVNSNQFENHRSLPQRSLVSSLIGFLTLSLGLVLLIVACVGVYQLRTVGAADFRGDIADFRVVGTAWGIFDGAQPPAKPAEVAGKINRLFLGCGLIGIVFFAVGLMVAGTASSKNDRTSS